MTLRKKGLKTSERTCIVTRTVLPPSDLIRFVLAPDSTVVADLRHKLPGRGVWVKARKDIVAQAVRRKLFPKAFKAEAKVVEAFEEVIGEAMRRDLRQALALANKAGSVVTGFTKVESAIMEKNVAVLIHAQDGAQDGRRKLSQALHRSLGEDISAIPVVDLLNGDELDLALGRSNVIHAALIKGDACSGFISCWRVYRDYCGSSVDSDHSLAGMEMGSI